MACATYVSPTKQLKKEKTLNFSNWKKKNHLDRNFYEIEYFMVYDFLLNLHVSLNISNHFPQLQ